MGNLFTSIWNRLYGETEMKICMVGLDGAGKTTVLYKLKLGETVAAIPTVGFNVEEVSYKNIKFGVWDIGGQTVLRNLWRHYYAGTNAIIFVVDSNDRERIMLTKETLHFMLGDDDLKDAILLVFANKMDIQGSLSCPEVADALELTNIKSRKWHIQATCAVRGDGLFEGLDWLASNVKVMPN